MVKLIKKDIVLFRTLRRNARATLTQISKDTSIPISTLYDRLKMHEKGQLMRHTSLLDFSKLGYEARVQLLIKAQQEQREYLVKRLVMHDQVNCIYRITNEYDFLVEGIFSTVSEAAQFSEELEALEGVEKISSHFVTNEIMREGFLPRQKYI